MLFPSRLPTIAFQAPIPFCESRKAFRNVCKRQTHVFRNARITASVSSERTPDPLASSPLGAPLVICVGEALYDLLTVSPDAPTSDESQWTAEPGGASANLAAGLARLSTASALFGTVGSDPGGDALKETLRSLDVNVDGVQTASGRETRRVFVRRDESGERSFVDFSGPNPTFADTIALNPDTLPGVLFYAAQFLVTGTLGLAFPGSRGSQCELVELGRLCKLSIVVDVNWRPVFWKGQADDAEARNIILQYLRDKPGADIVKISQDEVGFLFDEQLAERALDDPTEVLRALGGRCTGLIVTAGHKGAAYVFSGGMEPVTGRVAAVAPDNSVVDTTGAGDAFLAGFLSEMLRLGGPFALTDRSKVKQIAEFGTVVASFVCGGMGAIGPLPSREQVEKVRGRLAGAA